MKAGAFTPRNPLAALAEPRQVYTLNEGGGFHPRNPRPAAPCSTVLWRAQ